MAFIKTFESFMTSERKFFISNIEAEESLLSSGIEITESEGFVHGETELIESFLVEKGYSYPKDFVIVESNLNEALNVKYEGHEAGPKGTEIFISINGHRYGYSQKEGGLDIGDIARKFEKMLQFSAGKALNWLKKNTVPTSGSKSSEKSDTKNVKEGKEDKEMEMPAETPAMDTEDTSSEDKEMNYYMFFGNLKTIKKHVDAMLEMSPEAVDALLSNGHDWAADHIATSKDDIEEVSNWLQNSMNKS
jgi:hypothetical protein